MSQSENKRVIGAEEWCALPDLGIPYMKMRIDSGAGTSSLHAWRISPFTRDGQEWVSFELHPLQKDRRTVVRCEARLVDHRRVKSSSGASEHRYVVQTPISLGGSSWDIQITLTNRDNMGYRMLLGREAMSEQLMVDPQHSFLFGQVASDSIHQAYSHYRVKKTNLVIGLVSSSTHESAVSALQQAAERAGHTIVAIDPTHYSLKFENDAANLFGVDGRRFESIDAVIHLLHVERATALCTMLEYFEAVGIHSPNSSRALRNAIDRTHVMQLLVKSGCPIVPTEVMCGSDRLQAFLDRSRQGTVLLRTAIPGGADSELLITQTERHKEVTRDRTEAVWLAQTLPVSGREFFRFLVVGRKVFTMGLELNLDGTKPVLVARRSIPSTSKDERKTALRAARAIGLRYTAVDVVREETGIQILSVDPFDSATSTNHALDKKISTATIKAVERAMGSVH